jgi:glycosyltransferase involved in cell wall biosynthesis
MTHAPSSAERPAPGAPGAPMRITFVEPHLELYGGVRRILEFANRFVERGEAVTIYHPQGSPCGWMECRAEIRPTASLFDTDHDVVIFNNAPDYKLVRKARAQLKVFYILDLADRERLKRFDPKIYWPKKGRTLALKRCLQLPFLHASNATWMREWLHDNLGLETHLQLGGVNRELFRPVEVVRRDGKFRILCSGDPRRSKGTTTVVEAVKRVSLHHPHVELVTYHGRGIAQDEMAATYCGADLFVDAQWYAGWNNPVVEAMACGVPVVCSDIGGVADFAFHEKTALLAPARDLGAFTHAIKRMMESSELRRRLADNAREHVSRFDWDVSTDVFLDLLYRRCARERPVVERPARKRRRAP